ncbi:MAG TPA: glycoside hydrolase family 15 protein [Gaiellaceae bacterium]|jgi:GH15 family glucan-1,4-alpha-glucosidase|nr:glycoside hydrolase family 15 protein [Gaiellaceae bacterium]
MAYGLGIIGNCSYSALLRDGSVEWMCWPRPDSSFVFGPLLDRERGGAFVVEGVDATEVRQSYIENTNVLRTVFRCPGGELELLDFAPRFLLYDRFYKPPMLVRILRPLSGEPRARVRCRPVYDYGLLEAQSWRASNHIEYRGFPAPLRLTTNVPLTYIEDERPFLLDRDRHLVLTWGQPLEAGLEDTAERFLERTLDYWRRWVKDTRVPRDYQREVIRSALALKLHQFEDTGALLAATTTSLPEHPGSGRTWDYRYCWLRDAYFTLNALERLGHSAEMERFLEYLRNLAEEGGGVLQPVYRINGGSDAPERELEHLAGYNGEKPVRIGNQAFEHRQNDVYGEMVLAVSRLFLDTRFVGEIPPTTAVGIVQTLVDQIDARLEEPDAGPWEFRGRTRLHSFSVLMHWAGARRAVEVGETLQADRLAAQARAIEQRAAELLATRCWNGEVGALTQVAGEPQLDAALLLAVHLGYLAPDDPRAASHVDAIRSALAVDGGLLRRYASPDDFGVPRAAFTVCSFWLVEALALLGRTDEARELFERLLGLHNGLGLYAENILPDTLEQSGNFPQTYSHVGLINAAFRLSRRWD